MSDKHPKQTEVFIMDNLARKLDYAEYGNHYNGGIKYSRESGRPFYEVTVADNRQFKRSRSKIEMAEFVNKPKAVRVRKKEKKPSLFQNALEMIAMIVVIVLMYSSYFL